MTNKKENIEEKVEELKVVVENEEELDEEIEVVEPKKFKLKRKKYLASNGNEYFSFIVTGTVVKDGASREVKASFIPKDKGGYPLMDILFGNKKSVDLIIKRESMVSNGKRNYYYTYTARDIDSNGEIWDISVKPQNVSDAEIMKMLLK